MEYENLVKKILPSEKPPQIDFLGRRSGVLSLSAFERYVTSNGIWGVARLIGPDGSNFPAQLLNGSIKSSKSSLKEALRICFQHGLFPNCKERPNAFELVLVNDDLSVQEKIELFDILYDQGYSTEVGLEGFTLSAISLTNTTYSVPDRCQLAEYFITRGDVPLDPKIFNPYGFLLVAGLPRGKAIQLAELVRKHNGDDYLYNQSDFANIDKEIALYRLDDPLFSGTGKMVKGWDLSGVKGREKSVLPVLKEFENYLRSPKRVVASLQALDRYLGGRMNFRIINPDNIKTPRLSIPSYDTHHSTCVYPVPDNPRGGKVSKSDFQQLDEIQRLMVDALDERNLNLLIFSGFVQPKDAAKSMRVKRGRGAVFRENGLDTQAASHGVWIHAMCLLAAFLDPKLSDAMQKYGVTEPEFIHALVTIQNGQGTYWSAMIDSHIVTTEGASKRKPSPCSTPDIINSLTMERRDLFPVLGAMNTLVYCTSVQEVSRRCKQSGFETVFALNLSREKFGCDHLYSVPPPRVKSRKFPTTIDQFPPYAGVYVVPVYSRKEDGSALAKRKNSFTKRPPAASKRPHSPELGSHHARKRGKSSGNRNDKGGKLGGG